MKISHSEIQQYWDEYPCGIDVTDMQPGTKEFFADVRALGARFHPVYAHSDALLKFGAYKGLPVLEVGCGIGLDALAFAKAGAKVTAVDLSPKNVELAQSLFAHFGHTAVIEVGNAEELRFDDNTFDQVYAIGSLYYTPNTEKAVDEILRVLKPGGRTVCMFYNRRSWYVLLARLSGTNLDHAAKDPPLLKLYTAKEVKTMYDGFSKVEIEIDRLPTKSIKRSGWLAKLYNHIFVPAVYIAPTRWIQPFGFHIIVKAVK